jgi:hypothetical protein
MEYVFNDQEVMNSSIVDAVGEKVRKYELDITYGDLRAIVWSTIVELKNRSHPCKAKETIC